MTSFDKLCAELEKLTTSARDAMLAGCIDRLMPVFKTVGMESAEAINLLVGFMIASIYVDGKVNEDEYALMYPMLHGMFGDAVDINDTKDLIDSLADDAEMLQKKTDDTVDLLGRISAEAKADAITICLIVCSVDGKITDKEKAYIAQLVSDDART